MRATSGFVIVILTSRVIGQEYSLGTIRLILARGIGRVQLFFSKLVAVGIWVLILLLISFILHILLTVALIKEATGNLDAFRYLNPRFWHAAGVYVLTVLISMVSTILMAGAVTVLGRSFTFGLSVSIVWFPVDNILVTFLLLGYNLTNNGIWKNLSTYLLGPNLNIMAGAVEGREGWGLGPGPLITVDGTHTLVVALIYGLIFIGLTIGLLWKRDVKE